MSKGHSKRSKSLGTKL